MKRIVIALGFLALLNGCTREIHHYHTETVTVAQPQQVQKREPVQYSTQKSPIDKDSCDVLYTTYKQCYGLGIQVSSTDMCLDSGGRLASKISSQWGSHELGTMLGTVCAVACESANRNMAMPSYSEFANNSCN